MNKTTEKLYRELAKVKASRDHYKRLSIEDEKTNAYNYRHFERVYLNEFKRAKRYNRCLSLLMIDVDSFKLYNDRLGHDVGDDILRNIVNILRMVIRNYEHIFRFGGDEFVIVLPETSKKNAIAVATKLLKEVRTSNLNKYNVTLSIGISSYDTDTDNMHDLRKIADENLYTAKHQGKDRLYAK